LVALLKEGKIRQIFAVSHLEATMGPEFQQLIPLFRIFDLTKARDFYLDYLGFQLDWEHRFEPGFPVYLQVSRKNLVFHLTEHHGDCTPGSKVFIWMTGIREFHAELQSRPGHGMRPGLEKTFYGSWCIDVTDPFGNRISFNERIPESESSLDPESLSAE